MTPLDRFLVVLTRFLLNTLGRRFSAERQRVWWIATGSYNPRKFTDEWDELPETWPSEWPAGEVRFSFGSPGPRGHDSPPAPLFTMVLTRRMYDMLADGAAEVRNRQDIQLSALNRQADGHLF